MKVLSLVIPMYNTELYIERCLDSILYDESIVDLLDIIVVSDGSVDGSVAIAQEYQKQYPDSITVIEKENGGHGSAVNAGVKRAKGKYVRILDSDDWVNIDDFADYVKCLSKETADVVVTNVRRQVLYDDSTYDFVFCEKLAPKQKIETVVDKVMDDEFFFEFSMHSMTIKTDTLKKVWDEGLLEKTFYVDQQFVAKVFMCAKDFVEYDLLIYMYFIGRPEQSMGTGFFKHIQDHERVLRWLLKTTGDKKQPDYYKKIVSRQIELMLMTHYKAYAGQKNLAKKDKKELVDFDRFLKNNYADYYKLAGVETVFRRIMHPGVITSSVRTVRKIRKGKK